MGSEIEDFDNAKPIQLASEVSPEKTVAFFKNEEPNPLQPKEVTEELLARLYDNMQEAEHLAKLIEMDKKDIKELCAGVESVQKGKFIAFLKPVKGRKSVKWERLAKDLIGKLSDADLAKYTEEGEPSVRLEIRKVD